MGGKNSGGARPNTGPKKPVKNYSDQFKSSMEDALKKKFKVTGKTIQDVLTDMAYTTDKKWVNAQIAAVRTIVEILVTKETKSTIEKHEIGPRIGLPPIRHKEPEIEMPIMAPKGLMN